jgi:hypothetical protein
MTRAPWILSIMAVMVSVTAHCGDRFYPSSTIYDKPQSMSTYALTRSQARRAVLAYVEDDCIYYQKHGEKPDLPYRATFMRAMAGDFGALHTIFTNSNYHSGDNEDWIDTHWSILHAVGDKRFAAFLSQVTRTERDDILMYLAYSVLAPESELLRYMDQQFPYVAPIYRRYVRTHRNA